MKTKTQVGYIFRRGNSWFVRYNDTVLREGVAVRVQLCKKVASYSDTYRTKKSVKPLAAEILAPVNSGAQDVRSTMPVRDFIESVYLPEVQEKKRASTFKNYRDIFKIHLEPRLGQISLRQFRCCDGERLLKDIGRQARTKEGKLLGTNTLARIKSFLSGTFKTAKRIGALDGVNPMNDTSLPAGTQPGITHAYNLGEIKKMLAVLPEPARTVCMTAAFTGLRQGEIRGLLWKDYNGKELSVKRSLWDGGIINKPKTACSEAPIPVIRPLRDALEAHRQKMGVFADPDLPIFQSGIHSPLSLANLAKRVIVPRIEKCLKCRKPKSEHLADAHPFELDKSICWHGWHAFRRGLATTLHEFGVPDREIQAILRHSDIHITQASYIKSTSQSQVNAMDLVAQEMQINASCNETATKPNERVN
jgi:integrase